MDEPHEELEYNVLLEEKKRLSTSLIWQFQRAAYQGEGIENWRGGELPYYITSNPFIAAAYAKVVFAFFRDCHAAADQMETESTEFDLDNPIYIIELGSGTGRFAYNFLLRLQRLLENSRLNRIPFTYVMTDFTAENIAYWQNHSHLKPMVEQGILDFATFDIENDEDLLLRHSQTRIEPDSNGNPVVILANYVLDSIPQDLFSIVNGELFDRLSTIRSSQEEPDLSDPELISRIQIEYENESVADVPYDEDPVFNQILDEYRERLANTDILFPNQALHGIERLRKLGQGRMLFLSADKGYSREEDLLYLAEPYVATHGSVFSMMVNYHAIGRYAELQDGSAFHPSQRHTSLNISAFTLGFDSDQMVETSSAYREAIDSTSPDDFFLMVTTLRDNEEFLKPETALALVRLSQFDSEVLLRNLPSFLEHMDQASDLFKEEVYWAICQVWDSYYPIGEEWDLAFYIGMLLYRMRYYRRALEFLDRSLEIYGENATTYHNMALCYYGLQKIDTSMEYVNKAMILDPNFDAAKGLRTKLQAEMKRFGY